MAEPAGGVYQKSINSGKWILIANIVQRSLSIITFFILGRLLLPKDYGIMAAIFLITGFFETITSPGFERALMQRKGDPEEYLDTIWTFNFIKSLCISLLLFFSAPFIADFFHISESVSIIQLGVFFVLLPALSNSRQFYFSQELDFKKFFWRDLSGQLAYMIFAIGWAFGVEANVWALFVGHCARHLVSVLVTYILRPHRQKLSFHFGKLRDLFGYGKWVTGQNIVDYLLGIVDSTYVGRLLGPERLGLYTKGRDLSYTPVAPIFTIIDKVGFVAYTKIQDNVSKIQDGFVKTFDIVVSVTVPVFLLLLVAAGPIVQVLLGKEWLGIVVPLKILSAATILSSLVAITKPVFDGIGRPDINLKIHLFQLVLVLGLVYVGARWAELNGVAVAMFISWFLVLFAAIIRARPILRLGIDKFKGTVISVGVAALAIVGIALPLYNGGWLGGAAQPGVAFTIAFGLGMVYLGTLWIVSGFFANGPRQTFLSIWTELRGLKK